MNQLTSKQDGDGVSGQPLEYDPHPEESGLARITSSLALLDQAYLLAAKSNIEVMSRTRKGVSDVSSSEEKPELVISGDSLADRAESNFENALTFALNQKERVFRNGDEVRRFIEEITERVSAGTLADGQGIWRDWETEFNQTIPERIQEELDQFCTEFAERLNAGDNDVIAMAAWIEKRFDGEIHPCADGCGRTAKVLSTFVLARNNSGLPRYDDRSEYYRQINKSQSDFAGYYKSLVRPVMVYEVGALDPRPKPEAEAHNSSLLGSHTLGIEVTIPALAVQCGLGNIDPQHTDGNAELAAIEVTTKVDLPSAGTRFVTVRPDLDSVGAMVVTEMRARGIEISSDAMERIELIARADKFHTGDWPGPQQPPTHDAPWFSTDFRTETNSLAAIGAAVSDFKLPLAERVSMTMKWISNGEEPAAYADKVTEERSSFLEDIANGRIDYALSADGQIAVVTSRRMDALKLGYCLAPVVVALNPDFEFQGHGPFKKFTIAQYKPGYVDLGAAKEGLSAREPGWGGSPTILGSPQGSGSSLTMAEVVREVEKHLMSTAEITTPDADEALEVRDKSHLLQILREHGVPVADWGSGRAKTLSHLHREIETGEAKLVVRNGQLMRQIAVANVHVEHTDASGTTRELREDRQIFHDGRERRREREAAVSEKALPGEELSETARRALREELQLNTSNDPVPVGEIAKVTQSPSFPGLQTRYHISEFRVSLSDIEYAEEGYSETNERQATYFRWRDK